jgi:glycine/D-amino acid oxidase-like deaminating enzyme
MKKNRSPWIHQLNHERPHALLTRDIETDVAIVGAGIAGVATAFFVLKYTDKKVALLERYKLAHGATGHNAGQVVSYFERGFASLVREFGLDKAAEAERAIVGAWGLIDEMYKDAGLDIPFHRFLGHGGLSSFQQVKWHLEANKLRRDAGIASRQLLISEVAPFAKAIPTEFSGIYELVPQSKIDELLETKMPGFLAVISFQKGVVNSALFCQEVVSYLLNQYPERFSLYEHTPVHKVILRCSTPRHTWWTRRASCSAPTDSKASTSSTRPALR